jgi:hypothetical protein
MLFPQWIPAGNRSVIVLVFSFIPIASLPAQALTIYRIGGESLPPPAMAGTAGVEFVQRSWADLDADSLGAQSLTQPDQEFLAPVQLDPQINLVPLLEQMGGGLRISEIGFWVHEDELENLRDGNLETAYFGDGGAVWGICCGDWPTRPGSESHNYKIFNFDLGGTHNVDRVAFRTRPGRFEQEANVEEFYLLTNAGDVARGEVGIAMRIGEFFADIAYHVTGNQSGIVDLPLVTGPVHNVLLLIDLGLATARIPDSDWEIAEVEIYGNGYTPEASYRSNVIDLGGPASLGDLTWSARVDPGARVELMARGGNDIDPNYYYRYTFRGDERSRFDGSGAELTRTAYDRLEGGEKAGTAPDVDSWGFWSSFPDIAANRADLASDKPRSFLQLSVDFTSSRQQGAQIDYLQFEVTQPPLADQVIAEVEPSEAALGEAVSFTYKIRPLVLGNNLGFDSVEIRTPIAPLAIEGVRIAGREPTGGWSQEAYDGDGFVVHFQPAITLNQGSGELLEIDFTAAVFQVGTTFSGRVFDSTRPFEVRQRVTPGDADENSDSNTLTVDLDEVVHGVSALRISPGVFTPNGDGANDVVHIEYDLVNLTGDVPVLLEVYDLSGRRLVQIPVAAGNSGRFSDVQWDGRIAGELAPPGSYLLRLEVQADESTGAVISPVRVAY